MGIIKCIRRLAVERETYSITLVNHKDLLIFISIVVTISLIVKREVLI